MLAAKPGQRVRLRIINAGSDTIFDVALGGHDLTVTHSDGFPVQPVATGSVRIAMGERYDATVTLSDGVFPLVARATREGRHRPRAGPHRQRRGPRRRRAARGPHGAPLTVVRLTAAGGAALPAREPDSVQDVVLGGSMGRYVWTINGRTYDDTEPLTIRAGSGGAAAHRQPVDDAPPGAPARAHLPTRPGRRRPGPARTPC